MPNRRFIPSLRRRRHDTGASAVEFALVAPIFFLLLFSIADFGMMMFANLTMQNAVREGARFAVTGQTTLDPADTSSQRFQAVQQKIHDSSLGIYDMSNASITTWVNGSTTPQSSGAGMYGNAGDLVVIEVDCSWPLLTPVVAAFFPSGKYTFKVAATMRNEAF
ncbi:TadE/TadG family type IV pilus assembly protein [Cupriavidus numazuensis]|uniref:TadE-like domain-containing protein n=1 Tax=Cupriavidus numazuensis TaxID=221992 RepID=A0ABM8TP74_9BURK|nr:TadE/TadG family type IV pilus assembly protein [Cupriavidus numazuensis]CAG2156817.1 hypothetical protein LMG26411_05375 [Cupriavidus numazuensis]